MTKKLSRTKEVYSVMTKIIGRLEQSLDTSATKARLSNIRTSIGRPLGENIGSLQIVYEYLPEEVMGFGTNISKEEEAIFACLQMYAVHQQSRQESVNSSESKNGWDNIGSSLSLLRVDEKSRMSSDRRFNAMITSQTFEELTIHLRQLIKLLKSKKQDVKINNPKLAEDLFRFLWGHEEDVRLDWSRAYYSKNMMSKGENENE